MLKRKIKKILLFTPSAFTFKDLLDINPLPPLGLAYLGSVLEKNGIQVKIVDCLIEGWDSRTDVAENIIKIGLGIDEIESIIRNFAPDIVGVNNLFTRQRRNAHDIYRIAKNVSKDIIVIAGGAHATVMPENVLADKNVDYVVLGEGEESLIALIGAIEGRADLSSLDGIGYRDKDIIKIIPKQRFIKDLDSIPFPARHLLSMEKYFGLEASHGKRMCRRFSPIITSRGCPVGCSFCTAHHVWGKTFRKRSPMNVIEEMRDLKEKYQIEELLFEDDNVTLDVNRAEEIFDLMIKEKLDFKWDTPNGVAAFALTEGLIDKMKEAGCYKLNIAVESGSERVLRDVIKKPVNLKKVEVLIKHAKSIGLDANIFLIIGMPGETVGEMWDSYNFAKKIGIYKPFVSVATPYPGSELYARSLKEGYIDEKSFLDNLYITSCSISTDKWSGDDVRKIFEEGYSYLQMEFYKKHPVLFSRKLAAKMFNDPLGLIKKGISSCRRLIA